VVCGEGPWCVGKGRGVWEVPWCVGKCRGVWRRAVESGKGPWCVQKGRGVWKRAVVCGKGPLCVGKGRGVWRRAVLCGEGPGVWRRAMSGRLHMYSLRFSGSLPLSDLIQVTVQTARSF
jgi:hypothetical protein